MKKIMWAIALFSIFAAVFYSCTKESEMTKDSVKTNTNNPQMSASDIRVMNKIIDFKKKVDFYRANPAIKSGESKSVDSTVWYLEAATNFYYTNPDFKAKDIIVDSTLISIPIEGDNISFNDIQTAFDEAYNHLSQQYGLINDDSKDILVVDFSLKSKTETSADINIVSSFGKGSASSITSFEDWYWGSKLGKCDGTYYGILDATDALEVAINATLPDYSSVQHYFTDIESTYASGSSDPTHFYYEYVVSPNPVLIHHCMDSDEMDHYYNKGLEWLSNHTPNGKEMISCNYWSSDYVFHNWNTGKYYYTRKHICSVKYGIFHIGSNNGGGN